MGSRLLLRMLYHIVLNAYNRTTSNKDCIPEYQYTRQLSCIPFDFLLDFRQDFKVEFVGGRNIENLRDTLGPVFNTH